MKAMALMAWKREALRGGERGGGSCGGGWDGYSPLAAAIATTKAGSSPRRGGRKFVWSPSCMRGVLFQASKMVPGSILASEGREGAGGGGTGGRESRLFYSHIEANIFLTHHHTWP